jgi:rhamnosyltransferase subunit B
VQTKHIVITTFGSLGDLHPYLAIGLRLQARGHRVTIATSAFYRPKVESEGIGFHPVRPDISPDNTEAIKRAMDGRKGAEYVVRHLILPHVRASYDDLTEAVHGADLLVTHPITYAGPLVAEKTGIRWVSSVLAPLSFLSSHDPSVVVRLPWVPKFPAFNRVISRLGRRMTRSWGEPIRELRRKIGLPPGADPIFEGQHSPSLVLALFSRLLASPQPDWPRNTHVTGFALYDRLEKHHGLSPELARFLDSGPPPIVFTLGSSAVLDARDFFVQSAAAAAQLRRRAVLLTGRDPANVPANPLPDGVIVSAYAPYSEIFPRAAAIVHQCGAGTTGQALRAGRPMLAVPFAHDQPDNAARLVRLGVAREIGRNQYCAERVAAELRRLLEDRTYAARAEGTGRREQSEDGVAPACDLIESQFGADRRATG